MNLEEKIDTMITATEFLLDDAELINSTLNEDNRRRLKNLAADYKLCAERLRVIKNTTTQENLKQEVE